MQFSRVAWLGNEVDGAESAGVAGVVSITLPREDDDLDFWRQFQQIRNEGKAFVRAVWQRRQPEVNQSKLGGAAQLLKQLGAMLP